MNFTTKTQSLEHPTIYKQISFAKKQLFIECCCIHPPQNMALGENSETNLDSGDDLLENSNCPSNGGDSEIQLAQEEDNISRVVKSTEEITSWRDYCCNKEKFKDYLIHGCHMTTEKIPDIGSFLDSLAKIGMNKDHICRIERQYGETYS